MRCSRSLLTSSGLLCLLTELLCPMEVGVAGLDRLAGVSSDITKPETHNDSTLFNTCKYLRSRGRGMKRRGLTCAVEPEGCRVKDGSPGGGVMNSGLVHSLCCVKRTSWRTKTNKSLINFQQTTFLCISTKKNKNKKEMCSHLDPI